MHYRIFSSVPGLHPLDALSEMKPPKMSLDIVKCLLGDKITSG